MSGPPHLSDQELQSGLVRAGVSKATVAAALKQTEAAAVQDICDAFLGVFWPNWCACAVHTFGVPDKTLRTVFCSVHDLTQRMPAVVAPVPATALADSSCMLVRQALQRLAARACRASSACAHSCRTQCAPDLENPALSAYTQEIFREQDRCNARLFAMQTFLAQVGVRDFVLFVRPQTPVLPTHRNHSLPKHRAATPPTMHCFTGHNLLLLCDGPPIARALCILCHKSRPVGVSAARCSAGPRAPRRAAHAQTPRSDGPHAALL